MKLHQGNVVQWLEHRPVTAEVAGSNPVIPDSISYSIQMRHKEEFSD